MLNKPKNIFSNLAKDLNEETFEELFKNNKIKIERIVSTGQTTPDAEWYDQVQDEWVLLLEGDAKLLFENDEIVSLHSGDYILIEAHKKHRVIWTNPLKTCVWLAFHF